MELSRIKETQEVPFLQPTPYCDLDSSSIRSTLKYLVGHNRDKVKIAIQIFDWVRDNLTYRLGLSADKASESLLKRAGSCSNKANVLVALCRAAQIPAAFNVMKVKTPDYLGPVCVPRFGKFMGKESLHVYASVFLNGQWMKVDPTDDRIFSENTHHINPPSFPISFNGKSDAMLKIEERCILIPGHDRQDNIDNILSKKRRLPDGALNAMNLYMDFMRAFAKSYLDVTHLEQDFFEWFKENLPQAHEDFISDELKMTEFLSSHQFKTKNDNTEQVQMAEQ